MDLRVILSIIVAIGVYALLLKFLQKNSPHNVQTNGGGGKGFLTMLKKTALFSHVDFPNSPNMYIIYVPIKEKGKLDFKSPNLCPGQT